MKKNPQSVYRDILTLTETESRLLLGMTSNKTYYFQTTANHHRFIKVWTSIADLPTSKVFVQTFFFEKVWLRNTLPTYDLAICPNFRSFFSSDLSPNYIASWFRVALTWVELGFEIRQACPTEPYKWLKNSLVQSTELSGRRGPNRVKWGQTGPNSTQHGQTGQARQMWSNGAVLGQMGSNNAKGGQTRPYETKWSQERTNGDKEGHCIPGYTVSGAYFIRGALSPGAHCLMGHIVSGEHCLLGQVVTRGM